MGFWIVLAVIFIGGGKLFGDLLGKKLFANNNEGSENQEPNITINNYTTEQHLHISEDQVKELNKK